MRARMPSTIFISHAGADIPRVRIIAELIERGGLRVRLDRNELKEGDSFLSFMEDALRGSDYCLLAWSQAAAGSKWVQVEWESAFHRAVTEAQNFLIIGRLENHPVPELLRPRLRLDLFPEPVDAVNQLLTMWQRDEQASEMSLKPVAPPKAAMQEPSEGSTLYITSNTFAKTFPMVVSLTVPVALVIKQITSLLDLPDQLDLKGTLGCRFFYDLVYEEKTLKKDVSLAAQGVGPDHLLWLQIDMRPFSTSEPASGSLQGAVFRNIVIEHPAVKEARKMLMTLLHEKGIGS
jgi:TIR domain